MNYYFLRIVVPEKVVCSELVASQARGPLARTNKAKIARSLSMFLINQGGGASRFDNKRENRIQRSCCLKFRREKEESAKGFAAVNTRLRF
jgi:hypothetical protein